jgi:hypothetical protein
MKFLISEEEKSRILGMHQNATSRQYLSEQGIYNWESGGRKLKYKVQANKYYTSRDEGKTYTELTKPEDIDWVKKNVIKPENLDKTAKTTTTAGPAVTRGQVFPITDASGNQLQYIILDLADHVASQVKGYPVKATIGSIKFGTSSSGDYILMPLNVKVANKSGSINYSVYCKNGWSNAVITKEFELGGYDMHTYHFVMSDDLQSNPNRSIKNVPSEQYFNLIFRNNDLSKMNKNLADQATSYFCDAGSLRPTWKAQIG